MTPSISDNGAPPEDRSSYSQIVKSSSIMGAAAAITMIFSLVRTKFAAVLIGTTGVGLLANFVALQTLITNLAALGIGTSAVRQIAKAYGEDEDRVARTVLALRRACWITGLVGAGVMAALSSWLSELTFGTSAYRWHIAGLALTILLGILHGGKTAVLQGARRISQLAKLQLGAAAGGTLVSLLCFYFLGIEGLVPALVVSAAINLALAWYLTRQVPVRKVEMSFAESFRNMGTMARLGFALMWSALVGSASLLAINAVITQELGVQSLGIYSAGYALSGMFVNFVLAAMSSDYYPRLSAASHDDRALNRLVNEQTEVAVLLALPGLVATLTLAPWAIRLLYTQEFMPARELLQWFTLGCLGRVVSWPVGYLLTAKSRAASVIIVATIAETTHALLVWLGVRYVGLVGAGAAFFLLYFIYTGIVFVVGRRLTGFAWSRACGAQIALAIAFMAAAWLAASVDSVAASTALGIALSAMAGLYSVSGLANRLGREHRLTRMLLRLPLIGRLALRRTGDGGEAAQA